MGICLFWRYNYIVLFFGFLVWVADLGNGSLLPPPPRLGNALLLNENRDVFIIIIPEENYI